MFSGRQPLAPDFSQASGLPPPSFPAREPNIDQLQDLQDAQRHEQDVDMPTASKEKAKATVSPITCHVLDSSIGKPAEGVEIKLQEHRLLDEPGMFAFNEIAHGVTDADGRCTNLVDGEPALNMKAGMYKIVFRTKEYFDKSNRTSLYPWIEVTFNLEDPSAHYHIPLLVSPYSYTTYRGS